MTATLLKHVAVKNTVFTVYFNENGRRAPVPAADLLTAQFSVYSDVIH